MPTERVQIIVTSTGTAKARSEIDSVGRSAKTSSGFVDTFKGALAGLGAGLVIGQLIAFSDAATQVNNSLKLAGLQGDLFAETQTRIYEAAINNGQQATDLTAVYQKMASVQKQLGINSEQTTTNVEGIAAAMRLSTAGTAAQSGALQQLSQLLGGTMVQAQEYNSLVDGAYPLLMAVAAGSDQWGGSVAALTADVKAGNVAVKDFVIAMQNGLPMIQAQAASIPLTIGQSLVSLKQAVQQWISASATAGSAISTLSGTISFLANNVNVLMPLLAGFAAIVATNFAAGVLVTAVTNVSLFAAAFTRVAVAQALALPGIIATTAAWVTANVTTIALVASVALLAAGVVYLYDLLVNGGKSWQSWQDAATSAIQTVKDTLSSVGVLTDDGNLNINVDATDASANMLGSLKDGGADAGAKILDAMKEGGTDAANKMKTQAEQNAAAQTEAMNTGADTLAKSFGEGADTVADGVASGSDDGATVMAAQIAAAGEVMAAKFEGTGRNIYDLWNNWGDAFIGNFGTTLGSLLISFQRAQTEQLKAQAALFAAQAELTQLQADYLDDHGAMPGTAGSSTTAGGASTVSETMTSSGEIPGNYVPGSTTKDPRTPRNEKPEDKPKTTKPTTTTDTKTTDGKEKTTIINTIDPNALAQIIGTARGGRLVVNSIKTNRDEIAKVLGLN